MKTIRNYENKLQVLRENYGEYYRNCKNDGWKDSEIMDFREYTEQEADNDPNFFAFVFDDGCIEKFSDLTEEQKNDYAELLNLLDVENKRINR